VSQRRRPAPAPTGAREADGRLARLDWKQIADDLDTHGAAATGPLLTSAECAELIALYGDDRAFRSRVVMARHGFGQGEYKYLAYPLPPVVAALRTLLYPLLAPIANRWQEALGQSARFPGEHGEFLARCHAAGQTRPTPLILRYGPGDYNCLHQDLYGDHVFPLQVTALLCAPGRDFRGGEFVLTEQRPRRQSRAEVVPLAEGEAVIFAVRDRPAPTVRGWSRVVLRHGVSRVHCGKRLALGVIFHDAE
jgi:uncharacterized protein